MPCCIAVLCKRKALLQDTDKSQALEGGWASALSQLVFPFIRDWMVCTRQQKKSSNGSAFTSHPLPSNECCLALGWGDFMSDSGSTKAMCWLGTDLNCLMKIDKPSIFSSFASCSSSFETPVSVQIRAYPMGLVVGRHGKQAPELLDSVASFRTTRRAVSKSPNLISNHLRQQRSTVP